MRNKLREIINDMNYKAFTIDTKADYLLKHDVVPVVRCKECVHCGKIELSQGTALCCDRLDDLVDAILIAEPDGFCWMGERRSE